MAGKVAFVSVMKDADQEVANAVLTALNYKMDAPQDTEHATIYLQQDKVPADVMLFDVGDGVLLGITDMPMKKADLYSSDTTDFNKALAQQGALPMMGVVFDTLRDVCRKSLYASDSSMTASTLVEQAMGDATRYLKSIAQNIPVEAFKAEFELEDAAVALKSEEEEAFFDALQEEIDKDPTLKAELEGTKPDAAAIAAAATAAATTPPTTTTTTEPPVQKADTPDLAAIVAAAVAEAVKPLNDGITAVNERIGKAEASLSGTIVGNNTSGDERTRASKSAPVNDDFAFDTGMGRKI